MPLGASAHSAFGVTILEEALACRPGASARQCLIVSQADDDIAAGSVHAAIMAYTGTIRPCRCQRRVAGVTVTRWLPLALTGHDDTDEAAHAPSRARTNSGTAKVRPAATRKRARAGLRRSREL
jgi:hypothetical protein